MNKTRLWWLIPVILIIIGVGSGISTAQIPDGWEKISNPYNGSMEPDGLEPGGDVHNSYAWCQAILDGYVYVGSNRDMLSSLGMLGMPTDPSITPVPSPDVRGRIFRYKLDGTGDWEIAFLEDPFFESGDIKVGNDFGYRGMEVFKAASDDAPAIYVVNYPTPVPPPLPQCYPRVLKIPTGYDPSTDDPVVVLRLSEGNLRSTAVHDDRLFVGNANLDIWATSNPKSIDICSSGDWTEGWTQVADSSDFPAYNPDYFYNPTIPGIWDMISFNGYLYAFLGEPMGAPDTIGFLVYKGHPVPCSEPEEWVWEEIVGPDGKYGSGMGYDLNYGATPFLFQDHVYVGTFTNHPSWMLKLFGEDPDIVDFLNSAAPPQIYRFNDEDNWEMVIGDPHTVSVRGLGNRLILPIGNYSGGFYHPIPVIFPPYLGVDFSGLKTFNFTFNSYIWRFGIFEDKLYCTTFDQRAGMERVFEIMLADNPVIAGVLGYIIEVLNHNPGGFDLYMSRDGISWEAVTRDGFDDPFNYGGRSISCNENSMFLGTSNPSFGCQMWEYSGSGSPLPPPPELSTTSGMFKDLKYELSVLPCLGSDNGMIRGSLVVPDLDLEDFLGSSNYQDQGVFFQLDMEDESLNGICQVILCLQEFSETERSDITSLWWTLGDGWAGLPLEWSQSEGKWSACVEIPIDKMNALFGFSKQEEIFSGSGGGATDDYQDNSGGGGGCNVSGLSTMMAWLLLPLMILLRKLF